MKKTLIIALEGGDKIGKTTQIDGLLSFMRECFGSTTLVKYPVYDSPTGREITHYLNGDFGEPNTLAPERIIKLYADDRLADRERVRDVLARGDNVLFDRYVASNAFTISRMPRNTWAQWIKYLYNLEFNQNELPRPDLNLFLYLDPRVAMNISGGEETWQKSARDVHEADLQMQIHTADVYRMMAAQDPKHWRIIDQMDDDDTRRSADMVQRLLQHELILFER